MDAYFVAGTDLKKLYGYAFAAKNVATGQKVDFNILPTRPGWPRGGLEAYGILVECIHPSKGKIPSFLKIFKQDIPQRAKRNEFLIHLGLAKHHPWLFQGMPYTALRSTVNGVVIVGHIAQQIPGNNGGVAEDISRLRSNGKWSYSWDQRKRLAGHLCCAISSLEKLNVVHGDISAGNVMIGIAPDGELAAILCDYDGFFQPSQPLLPREFQGIPCRPLGSPGYQYPQLVDDIDAKKSNVYVETDRFALGVMVCEFMVWSDKVAAHLNRFELLDKDIIKSRDLGKTPIEIRNAWKDGFDLLDKSIKARRLADMASPAEWMRALGVPIQMDVLDVAIGFKNRPVVEIRKRRGNRVRSIKFVRLQNQSGNLQAVNTDLGSVQFAAPKGSLSFTITWNAPIFLRRGGQQFEVGKGPMKILLQPGDTVFSNLWEFEITDGP